MCDKEQNFRRSNEVMGTIVDKKEIIHDDNKETNYAQLRKRNISANELN